MMYGFVGEMLSQGHLPFPFVLKHMLSPLVINWVALIFFQVVAPWRKSGGRKQAYVSCHVSGRRMPSVDDVW